MFGLIDCAWVRVSPHSPLVLFPYLVLVILPSGVPCAEVEQLADHGIMKPPEMQGLTDEQIGELKLVDQWSPKCIPSGGVFVNEDPIGRRTGNGRFQSFSSPYTPANRVLSNLLEQRATRRLPQWSPTLLA